MYLSPNQYSAGNNLAARPRVSTVFEKGSGDINEDVILIEDDILGVFDGATSLVSTSFENGMTGGRFAADIAAASFKNGTGDLLEIAGEANRAIRREAMAKGASFLCKEELWATAAAVVRMSDDDTFDWCQIGDCQLLVLYSDDSYKLLIDHVNHDVETLCSWAQKAQYCDGEIKEVMAEEILQVRRKVNVDYGVLNGESSVPGFLKTGRESLAGVTDIILYTDGLFLPQEDPREPQDMDLFVSLYRQGGLAKVKEQVRKMQLNDIGCRTYPRFKTNDDIAGIAIQL